MIRYRGAIGSVVAFLLFASQGGAERWLVASVILLALLLVGVVVWAAWNFQQLDQEQQRQGDALTAAQGTLAEIRATVENPDD